MKNENETNGAAAPLQSLPNVKEHAPPPLSSEGAEIEKLHGGCCVSTCSPSSFDWRKGMPPHLIERLEKSYPWKGIPPHMTPRYMGKGKDGEDTIGYFPDSVVEVSLVINEE